MICRKLYAHKGSILLNSRSDHGKPRRFFFFGSSLERTLYVIPVGAGIVSGRNRMARKRHLKNGVLPRGPNFERPLLRAICFFCGVLKNCLQYTARRINSRSIRPNGRGVRAMGLSQNSARKSPTAGIKNKNKNLAPSAECRQGLLVLPLASSRCG